MLKYIIINMEDLIIGTWWLVALKNGKRYLTKASKVTIVGDHAGFKHPPGQMNGWVGAR